MSLVAIIPARGGSKRIPDKNIKDFAGNPIISYSIKAALESRLFDRIIVSTDSEEILRVAESYGAEVPFMRPAELADDFTPTAPVLIHALEWLISHEFHPDYYCCIYATAPFVSSKYLKQGFELLCEKNGSAVRSVTSFPYPILRALKIDEQGRFKMLWPEYENTRSNDLPEAYHDAAQFYWGRTDKFLKEKTLLPEDAYPLVLPRYLVQDIDTTEDWENAEKMYSALINSGK